MSLDYLSPFGNISFKRGPDLNLRTYLPIPLYKPHPGFPSEHPIPNLQLKPFHGVSL